MSQGIAYQNKDIASKYFADHFGIKSLNVYGLNLPDIKQVLPTNLPAIQADELRLDNLFLLMDGTLALVDYESVYKLISKIKYSNYGIRIVERYIKEGRPAPVIRLIVIYTADVEPKDVETELDCGFMKLTITPAFLSKVDGDGVLQSITSKIQSGQRLTDEELLQLMILPLSYKTKEKKQ